MQTPVTRTATSRSRTGSRSGSGAGARSAVTPVEAFRQSSGDDDDQGGGVDGEAGNERAYFTRGLRNEVEAGNAWGVPRDKSVRTERREQAKAEEPAAKRRNADVTDCLPQCDGGRHQCGTASGHLRLAG